MRDGNEDGCCIKQSTKRRRRSRSDARRRKTALNDHLQSVTGVSPGKLGLRKIKSQRERERNRAEETSIHELCDKCSETITRVENERKRGTSNCKPDISGLDIQYFLRLRDKT